MADEVDNTKFDFSDFNISDETDKRFKEALDSELPDFQPRKIELQTDLFNPLHKYQLKDICEWVWIPKPTDKNPDKKELQIVYFHDRIAKCLIQNEKIHKTEMGIYIYQDGYYQKQTKQNQPINHILNVAYEEKTKPHDEAKHQHFPLAQLPHKKITTNFLKEVNASVEQKLGLEDFVDIFNIIPFRDDNFVICVKNGLLRIKDLTLLPFNSDCMLTNKIDVGYSDINEFGVTKLIYEEFTEYIRSMVASEQDYYRLQELFCVGLTKVPILKTSLWLKGPSDSGKSTLSLIFKQIFGNKNAASISLHKLESDASASANLIDVTINFSNDLGDAELKDLELFMNILGKDEIYTRQLYNTGNKNTKLTMQLIVSLNDFPKGHFKYMNKFLNRIEIIMIKKVIKDKIADYEKYWSTEERKSVILYWLVEGLQRLQKQGYSYPQTKEEKLALINQESMEAYFNECCEYIKAINETELITTCSEHLVEAYNIRAEELGLERLDPGVFHRRFHAFLGYSFKGVKKTKTDRIDNQTKKRITYYNYEQIELKDEWWNKINGIKIIAQKKKEANKGPLDDLVTEMSHQRNYLQEMEEIIRSLSVQGSKVYIDDIRARALKWDIPKDNIDPLIKKLEMEDIIYQPDTDYYVPTKIREL